MAFIKKSNFLSSVYFGQIKQEKIVFLLFWRKKNSFLDQKEKLQKVQKFDIFQEGWSMVFVKKSNFLSSLSFGQIKPEKIVFWSSG